MFEDDDNNPADQPAERALNPADRAREKADEFRMHAELAAVFEGMRKYDAQIIPALDSETARDVQRTIGKLAKSRSPELPVLPDESVADASRLLNLPQSADLSTNDYHVNRRPGEVMIVRFLQGEEVDRFYTRIQAHFDAALNQFKEEERQSKGWKQDPETLKYLEALEALEIKMAERYLRPLVKAHNLFVLSDQSADEFDILHLTDFIMGIEPAELVGSASAPPDEPTEADRAWFFKLFALRGMHEGEERMCFFTYLQKSDDSF